MALEACVLETEGGKDQISLETSSQIAILDSGTSYMLMPSYDFAILTQTLKENYDLTMERVSSATKMTSADCTDE